MRKCVTRRNYNRSNPDPVLHPEIHCCKLLMQYMRAQCLSPLLFCDFHGHSTKKNVFMYGCEDLTENKPVEQVSARIWS